MRGGIKLELAERCNCAFREVFPGQFTTFWVLPCRKARTFSTAMFIRRERAARVAQARWGVMIQFLAVSSGLFAGGGSVARTSRAAPARRPEFKASANAASSTRGPRLVLSRKEVGFISERRRALTRFAVCGVSGQFRLTTSLSRKRVSSSTRSEEHTSELQSRQYLVCR